MNHICMIVQSLYPEDERVRRQAEALERQSVAVDVICMNKGNQPAVEQYGLVTAYRIMKMERKEGIISYFWLSFRFALAAMLKLESLNADRNYDLVQVHNMPDFLVFAGAFRRWAGKPLILDLHDLTVELFGSKWGKQKATIFIPIVKWVEKISCAYANRLITTSPGFLESLIQRGMPPDKITLVMNSADPHIFKFHKQREFKKIESAPRLLYHGTVAERFGVAKAIDAVALLRKQMPGATLAIYGHYDPSYKQFLTDKIEQLGLHNAVVLNTWVSLEEISQIINESDIGIVPYLKDDFMNLALSTKTFEYTASGLPVVASRLRSISSIFSEDCLCFADPASAQDLADKIAALCLDPDRRKKQTLASIKVLNDISGPIMAERYTSLIWKLMNENGRIRPQEATAQ